MPEPLPDLARRLIDENTFASLSTVNPDGAPQSSIIWVKREDDVVVFSTIRGRRKTRNMERDPRVSLNLFDPADPYAYVELRGSVELTEENGRELIQELSRNYDGVDFRIEPPEVVRVVCRLVPDRAIVHSG
jgi:PPOX class probable F420-dependent enzyme